MLVCPNLSQSREINKIAKQNNITLINRCNNSIKSNFRGKLKNNNVDIPVIYTTPCSDCSKNYIGESISFDKRMYQHNYAKRTLNSENAIVKHILDCNHDVHIENSSIIYKEPDTN